MGILYAETQYVIHIMEHSDKNVICLMLNHFDFGQEEKRERERELKTVYFQHIAIDYHVQRLFNLIRTYTQQFVTFYLGLSFLCVSPVNFDHF